MRRILWMWKYWKLFDLLTLGFEKWIFSFKTYNTLTICPSERYNFHFHEANCSTIQIEWDKTKNWVFYCSYACSYDSSTFFLSKSSRSMRPFTEFAENYFLYAVLLLLFIIRCGVKILNSKKSNLKNETISVFMWWQYWQILFELFTSLEFLTLSPGGAANMLCRNIN